MSDSNGQVQSFVQYGCSNAPDAIREVRNTLLRVEVDSINGIRWAAMTAEKQAEWTAYRQALLDITKSQGFPDYVTWPNKPE
jgi:hypothetical protein